MVLTTEEFGKKHTIETRSCTIRQKKKINKSRIRQGDLNNDDERLTDPGCQGCCARTEGDLHNIVRILAVDCLTFCVALSQNERCWENPQKNVWLNKSILPLNGTFLLKNKPKNPGSKTQKKYCYSILEQAIALSLSEVK